MSIPPTVLSIDSGAFQCEKSSCIILLLFFILLYKWENSLDCPSLTSVIIPTSVSSFGAGTFACKKKFWNKDMHEDRIVFVFVYIFCILYVQVFRPLLYMYVLTILVLIITNLRCQSLKILLLLHCFLQMVPVSNLF